MHAMRNLIGRTIMRILLDKEKGVYLAIETDLGFLYYYADGDCCSNSWFNDFIGVEALIGHRVQSIEEVDLPVVKEEDNKVVQAYGVKIITDYGRAEIVFRNKSNGYYGGNIEQLAKRPINYYSNEEAIKWRSIEKDWSADDIMLCG